jgi:HAD superfamily hydrolase (TIGR01490 family)
VIDERVLESLSSVISGPAAAFFDLDGTMARGHMIFDFPAHLVDACLFGKKQLGEIHRMSGQFASGRVTYRQVAEALPLLYARGVAGLEESLVALEAERFVEGRMGNVFHYSKGLVMLMGETARPGIAISGSPVETVRALARRLGMEAALGTELVVKDGRFTGEVLHNLILMETKSAFFAKVMERLRLAPSECFAFGDTEQDVSFLGGVGHPVALNPSAQLRSIALSKGWHIFDSAQDVVAEVWKLAGRSDAVQG